MLNKPLSKEVIEARLQALGCSKINSNPDVYEIPADLDDPINPNYITLVRTLSGLTGSVTRQNDVKSAIDWIHKTYSAFTFFSIEQIGDCYYFKGC